MPQVVANNRKESVGEFDAAVDVVPGQAQRGRYLLLADQVARYQLPALPHGQYLWQISGQVQPDAIFKGFSGRYGKTGVVYFQRNGKQFVKPYVAPVDRQTPRQMDQRARFGQARSSWRDLTQKQRDEWAAFSTKHDPFTDRVQGKSQLARNVYTSCQLMRLTWGDGLRAEAPSRPKPGGVWNIEEVPSPPGTYAFRIQHAERDLTGLKVMLEMSPAAKSPAHKPLHQYLVRAGQTDAGSFFALGDPDTIYVLESPRHAIEPGQRYLVRAAILTEDGLKGKACLVDRIGVTNDELQMTNVAVERNMDSVTVTRNETLTQPMSRDELRMPDRISTEEISDCPDG